MDSRLEQLFEKSSIPLSAVHELMSSVDRECNAAAYQLLTSPTLRNRVISFDPQRRYPQFCLSYLIERVKSGAVLQDDLLHSRGGALLELRVPMDGYWEENNCAIPAREYWATIENYILSEAPHYHDDITTHFLECCHDVPEFRKTMKRWREQPMIE